MTVTIPSVALAKMALELAQFRAGPRWENFFSLGCTIGDREVATYYPEESPITCEYYQIIDRIARGEKP